jgi:polyphenol oxidase
MFASRFSEGPVQVLSTHRRGGVSGGPYESLNLGDHVGDDRSAVRESRRRVFEPEGVRPVFLSQVHGTRVVDAAAVVGEEEADGSVCREEGVACVVMTADCLPVVLWSKSFEVVAAAHAGWRGLVDGVIEATVQAMGVNPEELVAWLGPCIGPERFEVGPEVREQFLARDPEADACFGASPWHPQERFVADLQGLARQRLARLGVMEIRGEERCTYSEEEFFSYRRDGVTGRMATAVWIEPHD